MSKKSFLRKLFTLDFREPLDLRNLEKEEVIRRLKLYEQENKPKWWAIIIVCSILLLIVWPIISEVVREMRSREVVNIVWGIVATVVAGYPLIRPIILEGKISSYKYWTAVYKDEVRQRQRQGEPPHNWHPASAKGIFCGYLCLLYLFGLALYREPSLLDPSESGSPSIFVYILLGWPSLFLYCLILEMRVSFYQYWHDYYEREWDTRKRLPLR